jgi:hypothetical protein
MDSSRKSIAVVYLGFESLGAQGALERVVLFSINGFLVRNINSQTALCQQ